jgi:large conductance mechanosensitive channel
MTGFFNFLRKQGVAGLAVGFILGGAVSKVVSAIVTDIVNPLVGLLLGLTGGLREASFSIGGAKILYGDLIGALIDFLVIAAIVYLGVKLLKIEKLNN